MLAGPCGPAKGVSQIVIFPQGLRARRSCFRTSQRAAGLLSLPRSCRFNLPNNLHVGGGTLKWGDSASVGCICSPLCSPILVRRVRVPLLPRHRDRRTSLAQPCAGAEEMDYLNRVIGLHRRRRRSDNRVRQDRPDRQEGRRRNPPRCWVWLHRSRDCRSPSHDAGRDPRTTLAVAPQAGSMIGGGSRAAVPWFSPPTLIPYRRRFKES